MADPGLGFGKTVAHNLALLGHLDDIAGAAGVPVLVGPSRKGFIGAAGGTPGAPLPVDQREDGTLAAVVWALDHGASMVRVHDVVPAVEAIRLLAGGGGGGVRPTPTRRCRGVRRSRRTEAAAS